MGLCDIFKVGERYSMYKISEAMAMTNCLEFEVKDIRDGRLGKEVIFRPRGKRKDFILPLFTKHYESAPVEELKAAIFHGWDQPIFCDTDDRRPKRDMGGVFMSRCMRGNACYNFVGTVEAIRDWIDKYQLNPAFDEHEKSHVLAIGEPVKNKHGGMEETETAVYPELYDGGHAVIDRVLSKCEAICKDSA